MISRLKEMAKGKKHIFHDLCQSCKLTLDYSTNKKEVGILKAIFNHREYADYFPFYKKAIVVDIGAHYGYFSIFAQKNLDKASKIIAIEPNSNNFKHLNKNIEDCKIENIKSYHSAVGGKSGKVQLYAGKNPNHSIVEDYFLLNSNKKFEEVKVKTLEEILIEKKIEKIDFLKMDCEGAEYAILKNTPSYIFDKITTISMEFHDLKAKEATGEILVKTLIENGFSIVKYQYDKTTLNLNYGKIIGTKLHKNSAI